MDDYPVMTEIATSQANDENDPLMEIGVHFSCPSFMLACLLALTSWLRLLMLGFVPV